jgi:hypothetical protein
VECGNIHVIFFYFKIYFPNKKEHMHLGSKMHLGKEARYGGSIAVWPQQLPCTDCVEAS